MNLKLIHASPAQQKAAFNVVYPKLVALTHQYVPPFFQWQVQQKLHDPNTQAQIMQIIDEALDAAENTNG